MKSVTKWWEQILKAEAFAHFLSPGPLRVTDTHTHPCRVTAVSTSPKSTILRGGTNATGDTYTQKHTIHNNTHFAKAKWWPLTGVGLTELANELTMSVSNQQ